MDFQTIASDFLDEIATTLDYDRSTLKVEIERRTGGPTVQPGSASKDQIDAFATFPGDDPIPSFWYDNLGSRHIEVRVVRLQGSGDVSIPKPLYAFQHHPFPGNCRIVVNRWVRILDSKSWTPDLIKAGLRFRAQIARGPASARLLVISTGASFSGAEPMSEYEQLYSGAGRSIHLVNLAEYLSS